MQYICHHVIWTLFAKVRSKFPSVFTSNAIFTFPFISTFTFVSTFTFLLHFRYYFQFLSRPPSTMRLEWFWPRCPEPASPLRCSCRRSWWQRPLRRRSQRLCLQRGCSRLQCWLPICRSWWVFFCMDRINRQHSITVMSWWARWRLNSPASQLYTQLFIQGADQRKHQSSASLAFVRGIHRWPVNSSHKGPVTRKMFPFDDVIMSTKCSKFGRGHIRLHFLTQKSASFDEHVT